MCMQCRPTDTQTQVWADCLEALERQEICITWQQEASAALSQANCGDRASAKPHWLHIQVHLPERMDPVG